MQKTISRAELFTRIDAGQNFTASVVEQRSGAYIVTLTPVGGGPSYDLKTARSDAPRLFKTLDAAASFLFEARIDHFSCCRSFRLAQPA